MNRDTGELRLISDLAPDLVKELFASGDWAEVPDEHSEEANKLIVAGEPVDFDGNTPLSQWGREQHYKSLGAGFPGANRAERRKNAKNRASRQVSL